MRKRVFFEIRHLLMAIPTLWVLWQFIVLMWMIRHLPRPIVIPFGAVFLLQDVLYNITAGTVIFWERPKEWLFTARVQRHINCENCEADRFADVLNFFDPGHVRRE